MNIGHLLVCKKSMYSDSQGLQFTINIYVVSKPQWEDGRKNIAILPKSPLPIPNGR
jgi:hypothetical protein